MKLTEVILQPIVSEKSTLLGEKKIYVFAINRNANKIDVKKAIKYIYGADASDVKILYSRSKSRMYRNGPGFKRTEMKRALVKLRNNQALDITKFEKTDASTKVKVADAPTKKTTKKTTKKATK